MHAAFNQFCRLQPGCKRQSDFRAKEAADADFGARRREVVRQSAGRHHAHRGSNVEGGIIADSGHWIMEEQPDATVKAVRAFLDKK